jgi:nucleoside 2-deoxyribosyltransferase
MANIYLATSWKNEHYYRVLTLLRDNGHEVYDFREKGFVFSSIAPNLDLLTAAQQVELLKNPIAQEAYDKDKAALEWADILVLLYPCGSDAHLELGYIAGQGKFTIVYINEGYVLGLMDKVCDKFVFSDAELIEAVR